MTPNTTQSQHCLNLVTASLLTIELHSVMPDTLQYCPTTLFPRQETVSLSLAKIELQQKIQRGGHEGEDDRKAAETPAPVDIVVESLRCLCSSECRDHIRRRCEGVCQSSILQSGGISRDHIHAICHASESNVVKHLSS